MACARAASLARILILRMRLRGRISIDRRTLVNSGCRITVAPGGTLVLTGTHLNRFVSLEVSAGGRLEIGSSFVGAGSIISARRLIRIGDGCQIAEYASIRDHNHVNPTDLPLDAWAFVADPITVDDNVWIGSKVTVTAGVSIGMNATCGAGAVVTRRVEVGATVAGVPARPLQRACYRGQLPQQRQPAATTDPDMAADPSPAAG